MSKKAKKSGKSFELAHKTAAIRARVRYICEYLFGGNVSLFAAALGVYRAHLLRCLEFNARFTPRMLAQIISQTHVRAEWLLCGVGPMMAPSRAESADVLVLPDSLNSAFLYLENDLLPAVPPVVAAVSSTPASVSITAEVTDAARAVARARMADKPVYMLLGADAFIAGARPIVTAMLEKKHVTGVGLTAAAADIDVPSTVTIDKTHVAKLGAQAGFGFGEALHRWGNPTADSVTGVAQRMNAPLTVHPEFGEAHDHFRAGLHGAEVGAAFGAVAYVDLLIFAENIRRFSGSPGGVCVALGEARRFATLFRQALQAAAQIELEPYSDFSFVLVDVAADGTAADVISRAGGQFHFIQGDLAAGANGLMQACAAIFDGTI